MEKWIGTFLNYNKDLVGLSDWKIIIERKELVDGTFAEVCPDVYEKEMYVGLSNTFFTFTKKRQKNILLHELIHCRIVITRMNTDLLLKQEEEFLVNDLTRGMEKLL